MLGEPKLVELLALGNFSCSSLAMRAIPHIAARPRRRFEAAPVGKARAAHAGYGSTHPPRG